MSSPPKRFVIIFPILATVLIFASTAGIIGNSILLSNTTDNRSFSIDNLDSGELQQKLLVLPDFSDPEVRLVFSDLDFSNFDNFQDLTITVYLADDRLPSDINTKAELLSSSFYVNDVFDESEEISNEDTFFLEDKYAGDAIHLIFLNEGTEDASFRVDVRVRSSQNYGIANTARILGIIFSSVLTAFSLAAAIYLWLEFFERIQVRFLTASLEARIDDLQTRALTWEIVLTVIAIIFTIVGYTQLLIGDGFGNIGAAVVAIIIVYTTYNKRNKIEANLHRILRQEKQIALTPLADLIGESVDDVKKILLDAIMYSNFPANYDFKTDLVTFDPSGHQPQVMVEDETPVQESSFNVASTEVKSRVIDENGSSPSRPMPRCAYCDAEAINVNAVFCHECGASLSSAK